MSARAEPSATLDIVVQPRASRVQLGPWRDGRLRVAVTAPPVDGEANAAVIEALADGLDLPRRAIAIAHGATGKRKTVRITGVTAEGLAALLARVVVGALALAALGALPGCDGVAGTLSVGLVTAPGSTVLDPAQSLVVTLTAPLETRTVARTADGFALALDLDASGTSRAIRVDALDASGAVIASGASPLVPFAPTTAAIAIYMAPPRSIADAPVALPVARSELGAGALSFGAILVGGRDGAGAPSDALAIYNAYSHALDLGLGLPAPRARPIVAVTAANDALIFGGEDATGAASGTLVEFKRTAGQTGAYLALGEFPDLARAGEVAVATAVDQFVVSGGPVATLAGNTAVARTDVASLPPTGAAVVAADGSVTALFVGQGAGVGGLVRFRAGAVDEPAGGDPSLIRPAVASGGGVVVAAGGMRVPPAGPGAPVDEVATIDPTTGARTVAHALATPRAHAAVAVTDRYIVVVGGVAADGHVLDDAEVFDLATRARVAAPTLHVGRTDATAIALPTGQVLIAGGIDASGAPIATLELFTPDNPAGP